MLPSDIIELVAEYFLLNSGICYYSFKAEALFHILVNEVKFEELPVCAYHDNSVRHKEFVILRILRFGEPKIVMKTIEYMKNRIKFESIHYKAVIWKQPLYVLESLQVPETALNFLDKRIFSSISIENLRFGIANWGVKLDKSIIYSGRLDLLELSVELGYVYHCNQQILWKSILRQLDEVVDWLISKKISIKLHAFELALRCGNFHFLDYVFENKGKEYFMDFALNGTSYHDICVLNYIIEKTDENDELILKRIIFIMMEKCCYNEIVDCVKKRNLHIPKIMKQVTIKAALEDNPVKIVKKLYNLHKFKNCKEMILSYKQYKKNEGIKFLIRNGVKFAI